jgi:hypothetical protein
MIMALARKELRELLPLIILALLAQLVVVTAAMGISVGLLDQPAQVIPFVGRDIIWYTIVVAGLLAVAAGLRQTMWESAQGTFQLLLHRPVSRQTIFGTKLAVGAAASVLVLALPVSAYALWAATPGTHASPFYWSMSAWTWQLSVEMPLLYLGAFISGLRSARWYGSRFLPVAGAFVVLVLISALGLAFSRYVAAITTSFAVDAALVLVIIYIAKSRDFS